MEQDVSLNVRHRVIVKQESDSSNEEEIDEFETEKTNKFGKETNNFEIKREVEHFKDKNSGV